MTTDKKLFSLPISRRRLLRQAVATGAGVGALSAGISLPFGLTPAAFAADQPPVGTWPAGSEGSTVTIGAAVPLTGSYAQAGADELKGWELAVEHLNEGNELIKKIAPKVTKGLLGKTVKLVSADSGAKPNNAVQIQQTFINDDKIVLMTGSTSYTSPAFPARTTPPARIACVTASARTSMARPRPPRSARSW
jgi:branched-chain amino acid transport system substrate-binding protein